MANITPMYQGTYMTVINDETYSRNDGTAQEPNWKYKNVSVRTNIDDKRVIGISIYVDPLTDTSTYDEAAKKLIHTRIVNMIEKILGKTGDYTGGGM